MISFKFSVGGQEITAQTDNAAEAMQVLSAFTPKKAVPTRGGAHSNHKPYTRNKASRAWYRWSMEEVKALNDNKALRTRDLVKVPELAGRSRRTLVTMRGLMRHPNSMAKWAPSNFRKVAEMVLAGA